MIKELAQLYMIDVDEALRFVKHQPKKMKN